MKGSREVVEEVTRCLVEDAQNEARIIDCLKHIQLEEGDKLYQAFLYVLTRLEFSKKMAKKHWQGIMAHREQMSEMLKREVSLRVAMCDYFFEINKELENPIIIEIEVHAEAERLSNNDGLTGLFNRRYLETVLDRELARARRFNRDLSLLFIDIDNFKHYNDTYGHLAGDGVLKGLAGIIMKTKRMIDVACRYGGEEFVIVLPRTPKSGAMIVGERIRKKVEALKPGKGSSRYLKKPVSVSGGISTFPQDASNREDLIIRADKALYSAKGAGKNRIDFFSMESRRFIRVGIDQPIRYRLIDHEDESIQEGRAVNISEGGLLCEVERIIPPSAKIWIDLKLPRTKKVQSLLGVVVHALGGNHPPYQIGVSFLGMQGTARQAVSRYIRHVLRSEEFTAG